MVISDVYKDEEGRTNLILKEGNRLLHINNIDIVSIADLYNQSSIEIKLHYENLWKEEL